jgi:hypothetical protein
MLGRRPVLMCTWPVRQRTSAHDIAHRADEHEARAKDISLSRITPATEHESGPRTASSRTRRDTTTSGGGSRHAARSPAPDEPREAVEIYMRHPVHGNASGPLLWIVVSTQWRSPVAGRQLVQFENSCPVRAPSGRVCPQACFGPLSTSILLDQRELVCECE